MTGRNYCNQLVNCDGFAIKLLLSYIKRMDTIWYVLFFSLIGGIVSLIGGVLLLAGKKRAYHLAEYATPFAAGALLAAAFLDLLKEGAHNGAAELVLLWTLIGMLVFFLLESTLMWFHHHHEHQEKRVDPTASLIIVGDTLHNIIDGIAIAAAFLISVPTGIVTTIAVAAHEIPQEIGDFGLLLKKGLARRTVLLVNIGSALATTLAALIFFRAGEANETLLSCLIGITAGFFIYIAASDIIPSIHETKDKRSLNIKSSLLVLGVLVVGLTTTIAHQYIDNEHGHSDTAESSQEHSDDHDHE